MKIKAVEITDIHARTNDWFLRASFSEVLDYTRNLLERI